MLKKNTIPKPTPDSAQALAQETVTKAPAARTQTSYSPRLLANLLTREELIAESPVLDHTNLAQIQPKQSTSPSLLLAQDQTLYLDAKKTATKEKAEITVDNRKLSSRNPADYPGTIHQLDDQEELAYNLYRLSEGNTYSPWSFEYVHQGRGLVGFGYEGYVPEVGGYTNKSKVNVLRQAAKVPAQGFTPTLAPQDYQRHFLAYLRGRAPQFFRDQAFTKCLNLVEHERVDASRLSYCVENTQFSAWYRELIAKVAFALKAVQEHLAGQGQAQLDADSLACSNLTSQASSASSFAPDSLLYQLAQRLVLRATDSDQELAALRQKKPPEVFSAGNIAAAKDHLILERIAARQTYKQALEAAGFGVLEVAEFFAAAAKQGFRYISKQDLADYKDFVGRVAKAFQDKFAPDAESEAPNQSAMWREPAVFTWERLKVPEVFLDTVELFNTSFLVEEALTWRGLGFAHQGWFDVAVGYLVAFLTLHPLSNAVMAQIEANFRHERGLAYGLNFDQLLYLPLLELALYLDLAALVEGNPRALQSKRFEIDLDQLLVTNGAQKFAESVYMRHWQGQASHTEFAGNFSTPKLVPDLADNNLSEDILGEDIVGEDKFGTDKLTEDQARPRAFFAGLDILLSRHTLLPRPDSTWLLAYSYHRAFRQICRQLAGFIRTSYGSKLDAQVKHLLDAWLGELSSQKSQLSQGQVPLWEIWSSCKVDESVFPMATKKLAPKKLATKKPAAKPSQKLHYRIGDLGAGTGWLGISLTYWLAKAYSLLVYKLESQINIADFVAPQLELELSLIEYNQAAIDQVTRANLKHLEEVLSQKQVNRVDLQAQVVQSDWLSQVEGEFDLLLANPPYLSPLELLHLQDLQDAKSALVCNLTGSKKAQATGLSDFVTILTQAQTKLKPEGLMMLEHGYWQGDLLQELVAEINGSAPIYRIANLQMDIRGNCDQFFTEVQKLSLSQQALYRQGPTQPTNRAEISQDLHQASAQHAQLVAGCTKRMLEIDLVLRAWAKTTIENLAVPFGQHEGSSGGIEPPTLAELASKRWQYAKVGASRYVNYKPALYGYRAIEINKLQETGYIGFDLANGLDNYSEVYADFFS